MLFPKRLKFRKVKKGKLKGLETRVNNPIIGVYGIKSLESARITSQQLESVRKLMSRKMNKSGFIRLKIFPFIPVTSKPAEVRMGKGKGSLKYWCFPVTAGRLLIEFQGVSLSLAVEINRLVKSKLPVNTKLVKFL
uniref:Ribosomal protein L16 n=1 Tax=Cryptomonas curvata TaxID=233186 RepID=A0A2P1G8H3_9CRYP|nr:ribosomal protein L16 [Cryptomonas curvata]AVM81233.1 ribosomal protein L16 [Cryptomonas curvata]